MTDIEIPLDKYCSKYETIAKEIQEGIDEGLNEGIKEGIKLGFIAGIMECKEKGFDKIDLKCMKEILKDALKTSSEGTIRFNIKRNVGKEYEEKISPSFKQRMGEACDKAVEEIRDFDFEMDKKPASGLQSCVDASFKKIKECIDNACGKVRKKFPTDLVFGSFFDCMQEEFNIDLDENLEACKDRICKEIDNKTEN